MKRSRQFVQFIVQPLTIKTFPVRLIAILVTLSLFQLFSNCHSQKKAGAKDEWVALFNGRDINDWIVKIHHHPVNVNFGNTFRVEEEIIKVRYDQYGDFNDQFGHLYYKTPFSWFHLTLEYRFVGELQKGAPSYTLRNSGVMFHSQDPRTMPVEQDWPISVEMQFLGGLSDGKSKRSRRNHSAYRICSW